MGRFLGLLAIAATLSLPPTAALAQNGQGQNGTRVGPKTPSPTYPGTSTPRHQPREIWSRNSDPVLAERPNAPGKYYDARPDGQRRRGTLGPQTVQDVREREKLYKPSTGVTVYEGSLGEIDGMDPEAGYGIGQGRLGEKYDPKKENGATIAGCIACVDGKLDGKVAITSRGVQGSIDGKAGAYLGRAEGDFTLMKRDGVVTGGVKGEGSAYLLGAEADINATLEVSLDRVLANGRIGGHLGGKAEGTLTGRVGLQNVGHVDGKVTGEISYGLGAQAEGYFEFDWSTMTVRAGGKASATLGIGAGVGFKTEISVKPAVDWAVDNVGRPVANAVREGYNRTATAVGNAYDRASDAIGSAWDSLPCLFGCDDSKPSSTMPPSAQQGSSVVRTASTTGSSGTSGGPGSSAGAPSGGAAGAGMSRN